MLFFAQVEWIVTQRGSSNRTMSCYHKQVKWPCYTHIACFVIFIHLEFGPWIIKYFYNSWGYLSIQTSIHYPVPWTYEIECWCFFFFTLHMSHDPWHQTDAFLSVMFLNCKY